MLDYSHEQYKVTRLERHGMMRLPNFCMPSKPVVIANYS